MSAFSRALAGVIFVTLLSASGCGSSDPQTTVRKVASLAASAHLVADARLTNAVPGTYAAQLFRAAAEELEKLSQSLESAELQAPLRTEAAHTTTELRRVISSMAASAEDDDLAALARHRARLEVLERTAKGLAGSAGQQQ